MTPHIYTFIYLCLPLFWKGFKAVYIHILWKEKGFLNALIKTAGQEGMKVGNNVKLRRKTDITPMPTIVRTWPNT